MTNPKFKEAFIILDESKLPQELVREIKLYNALVKNLESAKARDVHLAAIISSEHKIIEYFKKNNQLYPLYICYGPVELVNQLHKGSTQEFLQLSRPYCCSSF